MPQESHYYAHTRDDTGPEGWEPLSRHLDEVAELASGFASAFGASDWGRLAGALHDIGKYSAEFQDYIRRTADADAGEERAGPGRVDHSTFGAQYAARVVGGGTGQILAFCIAGHHAGLADAYANDARAAGSTLSARLKRVVPSVPEAALPDAAKPALPFAPGKGAGFELAFFTRMLFSCLVDADRLATERFCDPAASAERQAKKPAVSELSSAIEGHCDALCESAPSSEVNTIRAEVLRACVKAAAEAPGLFSLAVPTGGGKTLSSMRFALRHAELHGLRRVVIAVPFTSIIEQTADVYRRALGPLAAAGLVEHHSNIEPARQTRANQLASENWDAPVIVTTNVQLFDSLFASTTTPCRKLHRLARSVIVLDEAQTIPVDLLAPTLAALKELIAHYGCSVVLCTATQPALEWREDFSIGLDSAKPIVPVGQRLHERLRRVRVEHLGVLDDASLADRLTTHASVLCIVNTRSQAADLHRELTTRTGKASHLSTLMCAAHRRAVLKGIRSKLREGGHCAVVSTQLVEAGVDLDFPVVYRGPAGLDSLAQAAGRCNREGHAQIGTLYTFETPREPPPGHLRHAASVARELRRAHEDDPLAPQAVEAYFRHLYWRLQHRWDEHAVLPCFAPRRGQALLHLQFREASRAYQTIRSDQLPVLVPYDAAATELRARLLDGVATWHTLRAAQPYLVAVHRHQHAALVTGGAALMHDSGLTLLLNDAAYDRDLGLNTALVGLAPDSLIT